MHINASDRPEVEMRMRLSPPTMRLSPPTRSRRAYPSTHPPTHLPTDRPTDPPTHRPTDPPTHSITYLPTYPPTLPTQVRVLRLITASPIEEKILATANEKLDQEAKIIEAGGLRFRFR